MEKYVDLVFDEYLKKALDFKGRVARTPFWVTVLCVFIVSLVFAAASKLVVLFVGWIPLLGGLIKNILELASIVIALPGIALGWRRMHDAGHDGAWALVPIVNIILAIDKSQGDNRFGAVPPQSV